ncbi:MAG: hypothetical protein E7261_00995 [Lachnospiraceae bacterium]|nr:hypothetical protein [Lachnospiraceae bacterium]
MKFNTKSFRIGGYSILASVIVLTIAIVANIFINTLPASITQFDTTSNQLFTISEQTKNILNNLENDITIYWVVQNGSEDTTIETLLNRYKSLSNKISVVKKDPDVYPTFVKQYTSDEIYNNSLIVECGDRSRYISVSDIYVYDYDYYTYYYTGEYDTYFAGESELTSAISYVTNEDLPKIYILTGHGEASLATTYETALNNENMLMEEISLLTLEAVPEDADCILINTPQSDISKEEKETLLTYLQGGGNLYLITSPMESGKPLSNLEALMAEYGVIANEGIVIEGSNNHYAYGTPYYLLPDIASHTITAPINESGYYILLSISQGLTVSDNLRDSLSVTELLTSSDSSFSKLAGYSLSTYSKEDGDIDGPFSLAVAITDTIDENTETNIVWISSAAITDEWSNERVSGGNLDFFINAFGWMCDQEESIAIHSKSLNYEYLTIDERTASILTVFVVAIIPIAYLGIGIYIFARRKRR